MTLKYWRNTMVGERSIMRRNLLVVAVAVILAACVDGAVEVESGAASEGVTTTSPGEPGEVGRSLDRFASCETQAENVIAAPLRPHDPFLWITSWIRGPVDSLGVALETARVPDKHRLWFTVDAWEGASLTPPPEGDVLIEIAPLPVLDQLDAMPPGSEFLWGLGPVEFDDEPLILTAWPLVLLAGDDNVFVGDCAEENSALLRSFIGERFPDRQLADVLVTMDKDSAATAQFTRWVREAWSLDPPSWEELTSWERSVDPEETPAAILAELVPFNVEVTLEPALASSLADGGWGICTRSSAGWNVCVPAALFADEVAAPEGSYDLDGYSVPGEPVDVWILPDPDALPPDAVETMTSGVASYFDHAIGPVGSFDVGVDPGTDLRVAIVGTVAEPATADALQQAVEQGKLSITQD